jgi:hypothetical protein
MLDVSAEYFHLKEHFFLDQREIKEKWNLIEIVFFIMDL